MSEPVRITGIAAGGDGVGKLADGRTVFVPRTAPGDLAALDQLQLHGRFARARLQELIEPSPGRAVPACPHYQTDECGGCQLQHIAIEQQRTAKRAIVAETLRRIGRIEVGEPELVPSDTDWGYRTKLTLAAAAGGRRIGLHKYDRPGELFDLSWCHITAPPLMELWQALRRHRDLLPITVRHLVLRLDREGGRHVIVQVTGQRHWTDSAQLLEQLRAAGQPATIWWTPEGGAPRVVAGGTTAYPATVFEQIHPGLADRIRDFAVDQLGDVSGRTAWDLYAGIGETTELLAARGAAVDSVELDGRAVAAAERRHGGNPEQLRRMVGRAEHLVEMLRRPDVVIANPPRAGMDARVVEAIARAAPRRVAYISCDPATLARDLARLLAAAPGALRLTGVRSFDLFPQTAHVEAVATLESP